jgi:hypothetical protein
VVTATSFLNEFWKLVKKCHEQPERSRRGAQILNNIFYENMEDTELPEILASVRDFVRGVDVSDGVSRGRGGRRALAGRSACVCTSSCRAGDTQENR